MSSIICGNLKCSFSLPNLYKVGIVFILLLWTGVNRHSQMTRMFKLKKNGKVKLTWENAVALSPKKSTNPTVLKKKPQHFVPHGEAILLPAIVSWLHLWMGNQSHLFSTSPDLPSLLNHYTMECSSKSGWAPSDQNEGLVRTLRRSTLAKIIALSKEGIVYWSGSFNIGELSLLEKNSVTIYLWSCHNKHLAW